jgi:hypothetical protein
MSTTRIFVTFGIIVAVVTVPLIVLYVWFPAALGRFTGLAENVIVGMIGAFIVAIALDFTARRRQEKSAEKIAKVGLNEASQIINKMLSLFGMMIKASSNGFIPSTIEELFGAEAQELISLHLWLDKQASTSTSVQWQDYMAAETRNIIDSLSSISERYQFFLSPDILIAIGNLRNNALLDVIKSFPAMNRVTSQLGIKHPVLNIPLNTLKAIMESMLTSVDVVEKEAKKRKTDIVPQFPTFTFRDDVLPKVGEARFDGQPGPSIYIGPSDVIV